MSGDVVTPGFVVPVQESLLESACTPTVQDWTFDADQESVVGLLYMTVVGLAEILPVGHTPGTVALTALEYPEDPVPFPALTVYEWLEPGTSPVCAKDVAGPVYITVEPSRSVYVVAPEEAFQESCIRAVPQDPGAAESPDGEPGAHCATEEPPPTGIDVGNAGDQPAKV